MLNLPVHPDVSGQNEPKIQGCDPDSCRETAVTESLLPFINGPPRLKLVNWFLAAHLLNAKRYNKRSPQILQFPQSANFSRPTVPFPAEFTFSNHIQILIDFEKIILPQSFP